MSTNEIAREVAYKVIAAYCSGQSIEHAQQAVIQTARQHGIRFNAIDPAWSRWKRAMWEFFYGGL